LVLHLLYEFAKVCHFRVILGLAFLLAVPVSNQLNGCKLAVEQVWMVAGGCLD
jgi:hypothetical protein